MECRLWLTASLLLGVYISLYTWHWAIFVVGTIAITICVYFAGINITHTLKAAKLSQYKKVFSKLLITAILIILALGIWLAAIGSGAFTGVPVPHFRTNIITNECSLNTNTDMSDPWFYKPGCNESKDVKVNLLRIHPRFSFIQKQCEMGNNSPFSDWLQWGEVTCSDLLE